LRASIATCGEDPGNCSDNDEDGFYSLFCSIGTDCDDYNANINPGADEVCNNNEDDNCNGLTDCEEPSCRNDPKSNCDTQCDKDGDGYYSQACGGNDCKDDPIEDENAANIYPGNDNENTEVLCGDGLNNDCDGNIDCADNDCRSPQDFCPQCYPEICSDPNSEDEDCDGFANCWDEDCATDPSCITPTPTPTPGGGGGEECPCNNCISGCDGGGDNCEWQTIEGQCYAGVCVYDQYGVLIECEPPSCDPDETVWVCY
jgi:hypothetical protein